MKTRILALSTLAAALVVAGPAAPLHANPAVKQAQSKLEKQIDKSEDDLDHCLDHAYDEFKAELKSIENAIDDAEITANQAIELANASAAHFSTNLDQHANWVMADVNVVATTLVNQLGFAPKGFLVNDCGAIDKFMAKVAKRHAKFGAKGLKKLKDFLADLKKALKQQNGVKVDVNIHVFVLVPPAPAPGPVAPAPPALKFKSVSSAHDSKKQNDGKMSVRGSGPKNGTVQVNIQGPNGTNITKNVPTDADGCFSVGFPSMPGDGNPGNLPEGNYRVTISSGGQSTSQFHGV